MNSNHLNFIKEMGYIPVGLGQDNFSKEWLGDREGNNISEKNKYYGEYTFHYWLWKNYIDTNRLKDGWIGFCQYRKFWSLEKKNLLPNSLSELKTSLLNAIPTSYQDTEVILGEEVFTTNFKLIPGSSNQK